MVFTSASAAIGARRHGWAVLFTVALNHSTFAAGLLDFEGNGQGPEGQGVVCLL